MLAVDTVILGILTYSPCSGYDIKVELDSGGAGMFSALTFGSIYPRLKALEQDGLIVTYEADTQGRKRKVHELTDKGWRALEAWLAEPPEYPIPMRDELLLKMKFWGNATAEDRQTLIDHLRLRRSQSLALLRNLEAWPTNGSSYISEFAMLGLNYGRSRIEAELAWIDATIAQLEGPPRGAAQDPRGLGEQARLRRERAEHADEHADQSRPSSDTRP